MGLYAATRVRGARDYAVAGKRFGTPIVMATVFATWFGAETVLGIPATFLKEGLRGLVADPFGAVACLVLVGVVFARHFFRLDLLTLGDYFRARYDRATELVLSLTIAFSYFGWIAAQLVALGLAFNVLSGGAIDTRTGIVIGAAIVFIYTMAGGMWSVALTDFFQARDHRRHDLRGADRLDLPVARDGDRRAATSERMAFCPSRRALQPRVDLGSAGRAFGPSRNRCPAARDEREARGLRCALILGGLLFRGGPLPIFLSAQRR